MPRRGRLSYYVKVKKRGDPIELKEPMTPKRLQKLLYFCYSYYLAAFNESADKIENRLFKNNFQAWIHGPVLPEIYQEYKKYVMTQISIDQEITCHISQFLFSSFTC